MKQILLAVLFSTTVLGTAVADEFKFTSEVDAVTVFPGGAEVQRVAIGSLASGSHTVLIENLPANISADSVRVEGASEAGVSIGSVDVKQVYVSRNSNSQERLSLERKVEELNDEIMRLSQVISDTGLQRKMLQQLISNAGKPSEGQGSNSLSALEVADLLDGAATRLDRYAQRTIEAKAAQRDLQRQIQDLNKQIAQLVPVEEVRSIVSINVDADTAGDVQFKIKYAIADAGWRAIYDAKLSLGKDTAAQSMAIVRRAQVQQATSERWENVALTLSTARPSSRTFAPVLTPYEINQIEAMEYRARKLDSLAYSADESEAVGAAAPMQEAMPEPRREMSNQSIVMDVGGFQASYKIPGRVSISNTGETKSVVMGEDQFDVALSAYTVPRLDPSAYLIANFKLEGEATYLPGPVLLSRDDAYIGRGHMPMLAPGDDYDLSFGKDDFVVVSRMETDKKEGETGLISTTKVDQRNTVTTIKNLHSFAMPIKVVDRLPVSNHEDIKVRMLAGSTQPSEINEDEKRGLVNWKLDLAAGTEEKINFGYVVSWPKAMEISMID